MHLSGEWILLIFIVLVTATMLLLLHLTQLGLILHDNLPDRPHRRMFLASVSFFITFLAVRLLVASIQHHIGPFQYVTMGGRHIHHLVWGILILLGVGLGYLNELGSLGTPSSIFASRLMAILYGVGAALTLDEFGEHRRRSAFREPAGNRNLGIAAVLGHHAKKIIPCHLAGLRALSMLSRLPPQVPRAQYACIHPRASCMQNVVYCLALQ
jgi:hypothetical protein